MNDRDIEDKPYSPSYRKSNLRDDYRNKFKEISIFLEDEMEELLSESLDLSRTLNENQEYLKQSFYRPIEKENRSQTILDDPEEDFLSENEEFTKQYLYLEEDLVHKNVSISSPF